jgi:serine/threonine protein kinase
MEQTIFFEHYRICTNDEGSPVASSRIGAAINYKAIDIRSNEAVALQLIPIATVDPVKRQQFEERARAVQKVDHINIAKVLTVGVDQDYVGLISEYVDGDAADSWIVNHGPMTADAVLRIGLQVVRALGAAAFFGLTHRAIQPSNLMIVRGQTADGGWPLVKLLNFGLAGLEIYSDGIETHELTATAAPQFASLEQLLNRPLDFRSEMYSLGATMCFLLTGAVPLAVGGMKARLRVRQLPELRRAPKALRSLLVHMLRENPDNRPQDPVAFEREIQECLINIERRQAIGRKLGISLAVVTPRSTSPSRTGTRSTSPPTPMTQVWRGVLAVAALLLTVAIVGAFFLPEGKIPFRHRSADKEIGVPVGVPNASVAPSVAPVVADQSPVNQNPPPNIQEAQPTPVASPVAQIAAAKANEPSPPAEGPDDQSAAQPNNSPADTEVPPSVASRDVSTQSSSVANSDSAESSATGSLSPSSSRKKTIASTSRRPSTSQRSRLAQQLGPGPNDTGLAPRPRHSGEVRARFVGMTPDGRVILRLPSGRIVTVAPGPNDEDVFVPRPHRRVFIERRTYGPPPLQPFDY